MRNSSDLPMGDQSHSITVDNYGAVAVGRTGEILITAPGNVTVNNPHTMNQNMSCQSPSDLESHETKTTGLLLTLLGLVLALELALPPPDNKDASKMQAWHICNGLTLFALVALGIVACLTWSELRHYFTNSELPKYLLYLSGAMTIVGGLIRLILTRHIALTSIGYVTIILCGIILFFILTRWFRNRATAHDMAALGPAPVGATPAPAPATLGLSAPTPSAGLGPAPATPAPATPTPSNDLGPAPATPAPNSLGPAAPTISAALGPAPAAPAPATPTPSNDLGPAPATTAPNSLGPAAPTPSAALGPAPVPPAPATPALHQDLPI